MRVDICYVTEAGRELPAIVLLVPEDLATEIRKGVRRRKGLLIQLQAIQVRNAVLCRIILAFYLSNFIAELVFTKHNRAGMELLSLLVEERKLFIALPSGGKLSVYPVVMDHAPNYWFEQVALVKEMVEASEYTPEEGAEAIRALAPKEVSSS